LLPPKWQIPAAGDAGESLSRVFDGFLTPCALEGRLPAEDEADLARLKAQKLG